MIAKYALAFRRYLRGVLVVSKKYDSSMPTVKFDKSQVTDSVRHDLRNNIESLNDIASTDRTILYDVSLRAILDGGDLRSLFQTLVGFGVAKQRARKIASYLSNNATILMEAERREKMGIRYAIWRHSGAPCGEPEQDKAHKAADGKRFPVTQGLYINGRFILPGKDFGCHCVSTSVLPY